ncbi:PREDICTED: uncharacterized protein LOC109327431 [Lupinus angustifolius]|uniref:uncharacterized protein LOC109327431 n=1 Tax=Lupinus angustifolius TaxID=3871 RepID=UPI00092E3498|nr:PREDICTED: uncharacterized protein LOC109327431 [Lupinus angustifolius]
MDDIVEDQEQFEAPSLLQNIQTETYEVQQPDLMSNALASIESRLVGRLWADDEDTEVETEVIEEENFAKVLSKSGLGNSGTKLLLKQYCSDNKPDFIFIYEPMILASRIKSSVWSHLGLKLFYTNDRGPLVPNIWGICKLDINPIVVASSFQQVSVSIKIDSKQFYLCAVYVHTQFGRMRDLWNESNSLVINFPGAWCCIGDFNVVLGANECRGSHLPNKTSCDEFISFSNSANLTHLTTRGAIFTWIGRFVMRTGLMSGLVSFKFHKMWLSHHGLRKIVEDSWRVSIVGCPMISTLGHHNDLLEEENLAQQELSFALHLEEEYWKEKSRINWLTSGDRNTAYFHKLAKIRHSSKYMATLRQGENILIDQTDIANHALSYFTDLYATINDTCQNGLIQSVIPLLVSNDQNSMLTMIPSSDEIKSVVFGLNGDGAPSPGGFGGCFYQEFWDIVGNDVCCSITQFFMPGWILPNLNSNLIVLIPKFSGADKSEDFRPIALANFQFKVITKVLADRLAAIAPLIVSNQQRGFIKDRQIHDCICIASEAINLLEYKSFGGNLAIKLDVKKAFDTLDWSFMIDTLTAFGFDNKFIGWVKIILQSARLSISINGQSVGFFGCKRGVMQGDPSFLASLLSG